MKLKTKELVIFAMFAAMLYASRQILAAVPSVHLMGLLIVTMTAAYRWKALIPLYTYILLEGVLCGFATWWIPYLYVWTVLWGMVMLLPKRLYEWKWAPFVYMVVGAVHGFSFGLLYAPAQALFFGYDFNQTMAWVMTGLWYDIVHGINNFVGCILVVPLVRVLKRAA